jgi:hypothetical protein
LVSLRESSQYRVGEQKAKAGFSESPGKQESTSEE